MSVVKEVVGKGMAEGRSQRCMIQEVRIGQPGELIDDTRG